MSEDISREKDKLRLLWKEKRKKLSLNFTNDNKKYFIKNFKKAIGAFENKINKFQRMLQRLRSSHRVLDNCSRGPKH